MSDDCRAAKGYLLSMGFIFDCLGSFPLNLVLMAAEANLESQAGGDASQSSGEIGRVNRVLRLIRMTKLLKLTRMVKLIKYMSNFEDFFNPAVLSVFKLITTMLLVSHWFGCLWWLISEFERLDEALGTPWYGPENQWMAQDWLVNAPTFSEKYVHAFLWGAGMVTAMVPFDIMPVTVMESLITVTAMFIGLVLNAIVISSLTTALSSMYAKKQLAGKQLDTIRNYLVLKAVPTDLRGRVLEYYEYLFTSSQSLANSVKYEEMPLNLATHLALSINRRLASRCSFFRDVSNVCLVEIINSMAPAIFVPGQPICFEGQTLQAVYFINRGLVQLFLKTHLAGTLRDYDSFGLDDFVESLNEETFTVRLTARAVGYCDVMELSVTRLHEIVRDDDVFRQRQAAAINRQLEKSASSGGRGFIRGSICKMTAKTLRAKTQRVPSNLKSPKPDEGGGAVVSPTVQQQPSAPGAAVELGAGAPLPADAQDLPRPKKNSVVSISNAPDELLNA